MGADLCIRDTIHRVREDSSLGDLTRTDESVTFAISPKSFYQVNPVQTEKLYSLALEYAGLTGQGDRLGSVLWYRNHFFVFGTGGQACVWCGDCAGSR